MAPIFLFSLGALTIIFERLYYFHTKKEKPEAIFSSVSKLLKNGKYHQALEMSKSCRGPVGRLMETGIRHGGASEKKLEELLSLSAQNELKKFGKNIRVLEVIATVSPLMGLLGTVIGMVQAFNKVAEHTGQVEPSILAGGIWVALLTTAAGLTVAIPSSIMLHLFDQKIAGIAASLSEYGQKLLHLLDEAPCQPSNFGDDELKEVSQNPELARVSG